MSQITHIVMDYEQKRQQQQQQAGSSAAAGKSVKFAASISSQQGVQVRPFPRLPYALLLPLFSCFPCILVHGEAALLS
jgi:hypothetical protein